MAEVVDFVLMKANALLIVVQKFLAATGKKGISSADADKLTAGIADLTQKNTDQGKAVTAEEDQTTLVNQTVARGHNIIMKTRDAALGKYGKADKVRSKEFHVGQDIRSAKQMFGELAYMKGAATSHKGDLAERGLTDDDIAEFDAVAQDLKTNSGAQKDAQTLQTNATEARDASVKNLQAIMFSIQKSAKVIFRDQPDVLAEFKSIQDSHGGGGKNPPPTPPTTPSK